MGLSYAKLIEVVTDYEANHQGLIIFGYVTAAVIQALGF